MTDFYEAYGRLGSASGGVSLAAFMPGDSEGRVCPLESKQAEMQIRNTAMTAQCASVQLQRVQALLDIARSVIHLIVDGTWYAWSLVLSLMRLILPFGEGVQVRASSPAQHAHMHTQR